MCEVSQLYRYPLKSCHPHRITSVEVDRYGLKYDRRWAIFDHKNTCLTGRDYPKLLDIHLKFHQDKAFIIYQGKEIKEFPILSEGHQISTLHIHSYSAFGIHVDKEIDKWFSKFLQTTCQFIQLDNTRRRPVLEKHGGSESEDTVGFSDQAPLLILSEASLEDLNTRLEALIPMNRFRPNIVVSGVNAYEEDTWRMIEINGLQYKVIQQCERCVFTTIDIDTKEKHPSSEPLRTLATYRKGPRGGVVLGVHAVPLGSGMISEKDPIKILS